PVRSPRLAISSISALTSARRFALTGKTLGEAGCSAQGDAVKRAQRTLQRARDAGEGGGVAEGVRARLAGPQPLHEIEEVGGVVGLEGDHELLVVEPKRVAGVEVHRRVLAPDPDVLLHDPPAL